MPIVLKRGQKVAPKTSLSASPSSLAPAIPKSKTAPMPIVLRPGQKLPKPTKKSEIKTHNDFKMPIVLQAPTTKKVKVSGSGSRKIKKKCKKTK